LFQTQIYPPYIYVSVAARSLVALGNLKELELVMVISKTNNTSAQANLVREGSPTERNTCFQLKAYICGAEIIIIG